MQRSVVFGLVPQSQSVDKRLSCDLVNSGCHRNLETKRGCGFLVQSVLSALSYCLRQIAYRMNVLLEKIENVFWQALALARRKGQEKRAFRV